MANAQDVAIASQQHDDPDPAKAVADGYATDKAGLGNDEIPTTMCQRFSIRGYVATIRKRDINTCWPFPQHLLETRLREEGNLALPLLEIPGYRWWNCENCLGNIGASAERPIEKENVRDSHGSMLPYNGNFDRGCLMLLTSNLNMQEKQKKNMLDHTEIVEGLTVDKSGSTAYETDKEKKDDEGIVTDGITDIRRTDSTVSMKLKNDKSGIADSKEKSNGISHCLSNYKHAQGRKVVCAEVGQPVMEKLMSSISVSKTKELNSKQRKCEELQIICQASNSWEYFSRNKNVFNEISEKMKGKEVEQATSLVLDSENSLDAKKLKYMSDVPISVTYAENVESGQQVVVKGKYEKTMSKVIESLTLQTLEFSIRNKDDSHIDSDARNDAPFLNGNGNSCPKQIKECTDLSTSPASLEKQNMLLLEQTGKLKVGESRSKRRPQKKRSIADIIASKPSCLESWNEETEESKSADIMEECMFRTENNEQSQRSKENNMEVPIDVVKMLIKPTIETAGVSEVNIDAEMDIAILKKQRPEKFTSRKKKPRIGTHSLDACSTLLATNSSTSSLSEAVTNALQMPQGTSHFVSATRDKTPGDNFRNPEYEQSGQKFSEMEDEIPMDIVELMAKNQHERGLSNLKRLHENHNAQKDKRRLKVNKADLSHINICVEGGKGLKKDTAAPMKARPKETGEANLQTSLRNHSQGDLLVGYGEIDVCQGARDISFISNKEGITSGSCKVDPPMLQSTQWFNQWGNYSPDFVAPILDETIAAYNLPFPIDGIKSNVAITHGNQYGALSTNGMPLDSMQLRGASSYCGYMQMQNLCREGASAFSDFTGSVLPVFQNKSMCSPNDNGYLHQNLRNTVSPQNLTSECSNLGNSGKTFYNLSENLHGNGIPNLSVRTDGASGPLYFNGQSNSAPLYFNGQSNSALLQHVNAQARQPFGKKYCFPSAPMPRLSGQSVSVPAKCGIEESMATENGGNRNISNASQASSQNHASWFHVETSTSSDVMQRNQRVTFSGTERVFTGSEPIQGSMHMNEQITGSIKTIPPVPKFRSSGQYASTGHSGISTPFAVPGKANVALESSIWTPTSPFRDTLSSRKKWKMGLRSTNGYNDNLQTFLTVPPDSQITKAVKGSSSTKGLRSHRPTPRAMSLDRHQRSALDIYFENRRHFLQSPLVLGSNPKQNLTKEAEKSKALNFNKGNEESALCGKKVCNVEICTLNQNPAEINLDDEEDGYSFGYEHFSSAHRILAHSERKRNMAIQQGQKHRRTLKKKHLQDFLGQKDGYVGDVAKKNMDNLDSLEQEVTSVEELVGNIT